MNSENQILSRTEEFLKATLSEVSGLPVDSFNVETPFGEMGIDSFRVLKVIKQLGSQFGSLPKTLLFEHINIAELALYFVNQHADSLKNAVNSNVDKASEVQQEAPRIATEVAKLGVRKAKTAIQHNESHKSQATHCDDSLSADEEPRPLLLLERNLSNHPELSQTLSRIYDEYKIEGSVSRGTRNIAPNLFVGGARKGYINYARCNETILVYGYTGPKDYFPIIAAEIYEYCLSCNLQLNILSGHEIDVVGTTTFTATPFGVLQRVGNLQSFSLDGKKMRRLRYQVSKFTKVGQARTVEYIRSEQPNVEQLIVKIIDEWCAARPMVNPLIHIVKSEILDGTLDSQHRIFLTYLGDALQNVILLTPMTGEFNGYLMDLEFYPPSMPLGGLEFAIVEIIGILVSEGCDMLSLGGTYGCKLEESSNPDPEVNKVLDDLRLQNIFNDEGNLQFKNKFAPSNHSIYLCRPAEQKNTDNILDLIMMIADPDKMQTSDEENHRRYQLDHASHESPSAIQVKQNSVKIMSQSKGDKRGEASFNTEKPVFIAGNGRSIMLAESGYNPLNLSASWVDTDFKTDSWAQLEHDEIKRQLEKLSVRQLSISSWQDALKQCFPFEYFVLAPSGRNAEEIFCKAFPNKGEVLQTLLFPTNIYHQIDNGFTPVELPAQSLYDLTGESIYKANIDLDAVGQRLEKGSSTIAYVCVELSGNASGGYPVELSHLQTLKTLLTKYNIPLVLDATRVVENALLLLEAGDASSNNVWQVVASLCAQADVLIASLAKDFCVNRGGLIATNDPALFERLESTRDSYNLGVDIVDKRLIASALAQQNYIEKKVSQRVQQVRELWSVLKSCNIPILEPCGGHCVVVDVNRLANFAELEQPVASFLAWLYLNAGIRGGEHNVGMQSDSRLSGLVRLAVPVGIEKFHFEETLRRLKNACGALSNIPDLKKCNESSNFVADLHTTFQLKAFINLSDEVLPAETLGNLQRELMLADLVKSKLKSCSVEVVSEQQALAEVGSSCEIAVIGMAGRYPKAGNLNQLWQNLIEGVNCIEEIPPSRLEQRADSGSLKRYKGGFLDSVDTFDAPFFNIGDAEAAALDPQERLFLEVVWETLEDAGYLPETLCKKGSERNVGVYVGAVWSMYQLLGVEEKLQGRNVNPSSFLWSIANRVSYCLNFTGPSIAIDSACSSSLSALHMACESIRSGDCRAAIVGGVNLDLHQAKFDINWAGGALSKSGECRSFAQGADGYVQGEGVGALLLKPLQQAIADADNIHGVIKGSAINHNGKTSGYTIPNPQPQSRLIEKALVRAGVDATTIGYIETHGTASDLGDAIEFSGLTKAFSACGVQHSACTIGTVKTNIGHLEAASGLVGIQKVFLQMKHKKIVPMLHSGRVNSNIDFNNSPFQIVHEATDWEPIVENNQLHPLRAGISTFGAGGTNAHVILEAYEPLAIAGSGSQKSFFDHIFPLSAKTPEQLTITVSRLKQHLEQQTQAGDLKDIAYTLQIGRKCFEHRVAFIAETIESLLSSLSLYLENGTSKAVCIGKVSNAQQVCNWLNAEEQTTFVDVIAKGGDSTRMGQLWCDGVIGDWYRFRNSLSGRRISLPTYPFEKHRYWISEKSKIEKETIPSIGAEIPKCDVSKVSSQNTALIYEFNFEHSSNTAHDSSLSDLPGDKARLFVKQLFASKLGGCLSEIDMSADIMNSGLTSLDMAELTQFLKENLDPDFSPTLFFECTTFNSFYELLLSRYSEKFSALKIQKMAIANPESAQVKEVPSELRLPDRCTAEDLHIEDAQAELELPNSETAKVSETPSSVFLTGATGFLGIHILHELQKLSHKVNILCLVRAKDVEHGVERIKDQAYKFGLNLDLSALKIICGNTDLPQLGMDDEQWNACCENVDQIIHASAHVNHIEGYATFRNSSRAMTEIIRMAGNHKIKLIQFVSSIAGCTLKKGDEFSIYEKEDFVEDGMDVFGGYGKSKWVQESYLKRAHQAGIPYTIYRFGEISGSSVNGHGQTDDMIHRLLQMRLAVGCREKISSDVLDMVPVDIAARFIVGIGSESNYWNKIFHATHLKPYSFANLYREAKKRGLEFNTVTREQYLSRCYEYIAYLASFDNVSSFVLECVLRDAEGSMRKKQMMDGYFAVIFPFEQSNFKDALKQLSLELPAWPKLINTYFDYWTKDECGYLKTVVNFKQWLPNKHSSEIEKSLAEQGAENQSRAEMAV
ncbi:thioester reductase-like protein [Alteromonadaceae bacterium 2753L.S.0a.02]|nr:thioester reductase-like protein [Alteromonadaceae bacterium 2753L.S.0a.02]